MAARSIQNVVSVTNAEVLNHYICEKSTMDEWGHGKNETTRWTFAADR